MQGIIETFLLAMTPIGELRAAIPVGLAVYKINWLLVYLVAVAGNLIPPIFILFLLEPVSRQLRKIKSFDKFFIWLFERTRNRAGQRVKKYGPLALTLFVAVPLPITGAWTGSLIAYLFKIPFRKAFPAIAAGVALAGVAVTLASISGIVIEQYCGWQTLLVTALLIVLSVFVFKKFRN